MPYDVFISHTKEDEKHADAARAALESAGLKCWIAPRDIDAGKDWGAEIINAIAVSRVMLVIFSSHANSSNHITREVNQADEKNLPVITFRVEEIEPKGSLEYFLDSKHWLDAFPKPTEKHPQLIETVKRFLSAGPLKPAPPPVIKSRPRLPKWLIVAGGLLLVLVAVIGVPALWPKGSDVVVVNDNKTLTPSPSTSTSPTPTMTATSSPAPTISNKNDGGPTVTPTAPPDETDLKITQLFAVLDRGDSTDGARRDAIYSLEPLAKKDFGTHMRVVRQLTEFIRKRAPIIGGQCSKRPSRRLPVDLQAAIEVLGSRLWWYGNGETEPLDLSETDLSGAFFSKRGDGAHFEGVRLRGACLDNALLGGANFQCAYLNGASVSDIDVSNTNFIGADLGSLRNKSEPQMNMAQREGRAACPP
jgi:hypothetical protein